MVQKNSGGRRGQPTEPLDGVSGAVRFSRTVASSTSIARTARRTRTKRWTSTPHPNPPRQAVVPTHFVDTSLPPPSGNAMRASFVTSMRPSAQDHSSPSEHEPAGRNGPTQHGCGAASPRAREPHQGGVRLRPLAAGRLDPRAYSDLLGDERAATVGAPSSWAAWPGSLRRPCTSRTLP